MCWHHGNKEAANTLLLNEQQRQTCNQTHLHLKIDENDPNCRDSWNVPLHSQYLFCTHGVTAPSQVPSKHLTQDYILTGTVLLSASFMVRKLTDKKPEPSLEAEFVKDLWIVQCNLDLWLKKGSTGLQPVLLGSEFSHQCSSSWSGRWPAAILAPEVTVTHQFTTKYLIIFLWSSFQSHESEAGNGDVSSGWDNVDKQVGRITVLLSVSCSWGRNSNMLPTNFKNPSKRWIPQIPVMVLLIIVEEKTWAETLQTRDHRAEHIHLYASEASRHHQPFYCFSSDLLKPSPDFWRQRTVCVCDTSVLCLLSIHLPLLSLCPFTGSQ